MAAHEGRRLSASPKPSFERLDATVRGRVQGVGFRWFVVRHAAQLGLVGWAANERDGSVRVIAEGPETALDRLGDLLAKGPSGAHVERVDSARTPASGEFTTFRIRPGAHQGD